MPCYLFTFHAYRSWMPDHKRGFTRRKDGIVERNVGLAAAYEREAKQQPVDFDSAVQRWLIDETQVNAKFQRVRVHAVATDSTHLHALVSWGDERDWLRIRTSLKTSLTRRLNRERQQRSWFAEPGSRKRVVDRKHFDYLESMYLPKPSGWQWNETDGLFHPNSRRATALPAAADESSPPPPGGC
jgi:hypothetical protein